jgi:energy-converting hydrogenase Eha subunit C
VAHAGGRDSRASGWPLTAVVVLALAGLGVSVAIVAAGVLVVDLVDVTFERLAGVIIEAPV